jgi:hypothetical protein
MIVVAVILAFVSLGFVMAAYWTVRSLRAHRIIEDPQAPLLIDDDEMELLLG